MPDSAGIEPGTDPDKASVARMYDAMLGGQHNFAIDREAVAAFTAIDPQVRTLARANRAFLGRAVRFLIEAGVRQFIDLGSGIPTQGNVHEVAQAASPGARVVYVDNDPVAVAHSTSLLADNPDADIVDADIRRPADVLASPQVRKLIDFDQPVAVLMNAILHFVTPEEDPAGIVAAFHDALPGGSWLALTHATNQDRPDTADAVGKLYRSRATSPVSARSHDEIRGLFAGFDLVDPGLVYVPLWRPAPDDLIPDKPSEYWVYAGVGRKGP
ncbi:SAM-dependent methyltransferase [Streptomyces sp. NBC_00201]|uniref:SAM-dependent methyltransferase n=2 Tax=unclassified Streptomyces TaxID=2593676 RepID=UPI002250C3EA|nr:MULTISPECIES: SAM-dependent methyltransferase [unclassified Streptomyces]MCX5059464.1 SAM-dependent methyltransferase [Streptomyces sp. NBC_00452]MCX5243891.1 SAM-dependent methyltransferase [Streptomyces sp. NBC_00201]MCX5290375.1 SAM-dependent methyltransferase [Streptomyces sp. NBC_00183]